jgi:hypothetical protein
VKLVGAHSIEELTPAHVTQLTRLRQAEITAPVGEH